MRNVSSERIKKYFSTGSEYITGLALDLYGESLDRTGEEAFSNAINIGIKNTIAALYEADVDEETIYTVLNDVWGIKREEAEERLRHEKVDATVRTVRQHLKQQGYSAADIKQFMSENHISSKIKSHHYLWDLRRDPEILVTAIQSI